MKEPLVDLLLDQPREVVPHLVSSGLVRVDPILARPLVLHLGVAILQGLEGGDLDLQGPDITALAF